MKPRCIAPVGHRYLAFGALACRLRNYLPKRSRSRERPACCWSALVILAAAGFSVFTGLSRSHPRRTGSRAADGRSRDPAGGDDPSDARRQGRRSSSCRAISTRFRPAAIYPRASGYVAGVVQGHRRACGEGREARRHRHVPTSTSNSLRPRPTSPTPSPIPSSRPRPPSDTISSSRPRSSPSRRTTRGRPTPPPRPPRSTARRPIWRGSSR